MRNFVKKDRTNEPTGCPKILAQSAVLTYINSIVFLCNR